MPQQSGVVAGSHGTGAAFPAGRCLPVAIHGCPRHVPAAGDTHQAVHPIHGGRDRPAHRLDLRRAKGAPASRRAIFSRNSSVSMVISPTLPFSRTTSSSRSSLLRSFSAASAANKARSRHSDNRAAVTLSSLPSAPGVHPAAAGLPLVASASPRSVAAVARRRTCLRQLLGGAPTSPLAPSSPSFRPFGSPSFAVRLTAAECLTKP